MTLAERLSVKVYCTSSASKVQWRHLTHLESGYAALIDYVLDRYARRFGAVWPERASELQRRLADKYCPHSWQTRRVFQNRHSNVYPVNLSRALTTLAWQYDAPDAPYAPLNNTDHCYFCGSVIRYDVVHGMRHGKKLVVRNEQCAAAMSDWWLRKVCRSKKCRALGAHTQKWAWKSPEHLLTRLLLEMIKNGQDNPHKRRLEKHFV